jgi:tRNA-binding EMAP/Myf-like protein
MKVELKVGEIIACEPVPKSSKLLKETVKFGNETRTIVSGIAKHYTPEEMVGKKVVVVSNLAPRKIRGIESKGMLLASSGKDKINVIFAPESEDTFFFNASHFTPSMLETTKHNDELVPSKNTYVYLDYRFDIRGNRGYYETVEPERKWDFEPIDFAISFKPSSAEIDSVEYKSVKR